MNIVQVTAGTLRLPPSLGGGVESFVFKISVHLVKKGHQVAILDRKYQSVDPSVEYVDGVKIVRLNARRFDFTFLRQSPRFSSACLTVSSILDQVALALQAKKYLRKNNFDVIHAHPLIVTAVIVFFGVKNEVLYSSHINTWALNSPSILDRIGFALEAWVMKRVGAASVLNEFVKRKIMVGAPAISISVIPVGVDTSFFKPGVESEDISAKYKLGDRFVVLFVGRITSHKGIEYLVEAANILINHRDQKNLVFILVGPTERFEAIGSTSSPYKRYIEDLVKNYNLHRHIILAGSLPIEELRNLFRICDLFVLPSLTEATPQVTLEAMASAKPVVATMVGGVSEQIKDGWNGYLVEPGNATQLADKIEILMTNPEIKRRMGENARIHVGIKYRWDMIADRFAELYDIIKH